MILRPETDAELLALIVEVTTDPALGLNTAAMLAFLFSAKYLDNCPTREPLAYLLRGDGRKGLGVARLARMVRDAENAGYMARATWRVPRVRRRVLYSFVVGTKANVAAACEQGGAL
jgi:hypothetical protein